MSSIRNEVRAEFHHIAGLDRPGLPSSAFTIRLGRPPRDASHLTPSGRRRHRDRRGRRFESATIALDPGAIEVPSGKRAARRRQ